jgi:hypothetical protein
MRAMRIVVETFMFLMVVTALLAVYAPAHAQEMIIWYDSQGHAHSAESPQDIPSEYRPQASGVLTRLDPAMAQMAAEEGAKAAADPVIYRDGLGLFQQVKFEMDMEQQTGYVFVGTKYNLVKAAAAQAALKGGKQPTGYVANVNASDGLPVAFYSWGFKPVLMLLMQGGTIIKGDEGFPKDIDPGMTVPAFVKTFPYEAIDFSKPVQIQLYSREGAMVQMQIDLPAYK